jgi:hypothetical protein
MDGILIWDCSVTTKADTQRSAAVSAAGSGASRPRRRGQHSGVSAEPTGSPGKNSFCERLLRPSAETQRAPLDSYTTLTERIPTRDDTTAVQRFISGDDERYVWE